MIQCVPSIYWVTTLRLLTRESNEIPLMVNLVEMNFLQFLVLWNFIWNIKSCFGLGMWNSSTQSVLFILFYEPRWRHVFGPPRSSQTLIDILENSCSAATDYISPTKLLLQQHFLPRNYREISVIWVRLKEKFMSQERISYILISIRSIH